MQLPVTILVVILGSGLIAWELSRIGIHQGYAPIQPIAFSHKIHAGDGKIACLYCHYAARTSRHAGIPPAGVCMNCHNLVEKQTVEIEKLKEALQQSQHLSSLGAISGLGQFLDGLEQRGDVLLAQHPRTGRQGLIRFWRILCECLQIALQGHLVTLHKRIDDFLRRILRQRLCDQLLQPS